MKAPDRPGVSSHAMRILSILAGLTLMAAGTFFVVLTWAFSTMIEPEIQGPARQAEVWRRMTTGGAGELGVGIILLVAGAWLAWAGGRKPR